MNIPTLRADIRFSSFDEASSSNERYLVEAGESCFAVSPEMYHLLALLSEGPASIETLTVRLNERAGQTLSVDDVTRLLESRIPPALRAEHPETRRKTPFLASVKLFSGPTVAPITSRLTWLYDKRIVVLVVIAFAITMTLTIPAASSAIHNPLTGTELAILYGAVAIIGLIHELGHATASFRYGCEHGEVGFGLYYIFPAFYADVTKAWRLPAKQRAVIDLGGLYFNALTLIPIGAFALITDNRIALRIIWITLFVMLQNLNPMFKLDGYWLFSDLSGLTNLHARVSESFRSRKIAFAGLRRGLLATYMIAVVLYGVFIADFLIRAVRNVIEKLPGASGWELVGVSLWGLVLAATIVSLLYRTASAMLPLSKAAAWPPHSILALPFTKEALAIIARLHAEKRYFLCIEETPVTADALRRFKGRRAMVAPAAAMIRHRRTASPAQLARTIYITFPDHHRTSVAASRVLPFLGEDHHVPVTESLLYFRGASPLITLTTNGFARYDTPPHDPVTEDDALSLMRWLIGHVETYIRESNDELLSKSAIPQRTVAAERLNRGVEARMVEGFVRTWKIDPDTLRWSLGELTRIVKEAR